MAQSDAAAARTINLVRSPARDGIGVFRITTAGRSQFYTLREIPCEIGGRGFVVHRLGMGTVYHVRIHTPHDSTCECLGFLRWGRCKHALGLRALIRQGQLEASKPAHPGNQEAPPDTAASG